MKTPDVPLLLTVARLALAPALWRLAWRRRERLFCAGLLAELALDIADGVLARRISPPATLARQRRWDGAVDAVIYLSVPWCVLRLRPGVVRAQAGPLAALLAAHLIDFAAGVARFGQLPRYHAWSFKLTAGALGLAVPTLFRWGDGSRPFRLALLAATLAHAENVAITLALPGWQTPVPTLLHAFQARDDGPKSSSASVAEPEPPGGAPRASSCEGPVCGRHNTVRGVSQRQSGECNDSPPCTLPCSQTGLMGGV